MFVWGSGEDVSDKYFLYYITLQGQAKAFMHTVSKHFIIQIHAKIPSF